MEKYIRVKIETKNGGTRFLTYKPVPVSEATTLICETDCPYKDVCDKIRDPRNPENEDLRFLDFCSDLGMTEEDRAKGNTKGADYVPVEGTIETELGDLQDIFQDIIKSDPVVKTSDVIDSICPGWCDDYCPDHKNCSAKNNTCILKNLFMKRDGRGE